MSIDQKAERQKNIDHARKLFLAANKNLKLYYDRLAIFSLSAITFSITLIGLLSNADRVDDLHEVPSLLFSLRLSWASFALAAIAATLAVRFDGKSIETNAMHSVNKALNSSKKPLFAFKDREFTEAYMARQYAYSRLAVFVRSFAEVSALVGFVFLMFFLFTLSPQLLGV